MEIIGKNLEAGFAVESTRGTAEATAEKWLKGITANVVLKVEKVIDESVIGVLEDSQNARVVRKWAEGDLEGNAHADAIGNLLFNVYGGVTTSLTSTGVYSHIFEVAQNINHPSLSIFVKDGSVQQKVYSNGMIGSLEITATQNEFVKFRASFIAGGENSNADTPSYDTESDFIGKDITVKIADTAGGLAGATAQKVKDLSVSFDTGLIADYVLGAFTPDDIYNANMAITGELTLNFADTTFKDLYESGNAKYMEISVVGSQNIGGANNPKIVIILNKVKVMDWDRSGSGADLVTQTVGFKAFYNETDGEQSKTTVQNNTPLYTSNISV